LLLSALPPRERIEELEELMVSELWRDRDGVEGSEEDEEEEEEEEGLQAACIFAGAVAPVLGWPDPISPGPILPIALGME
jgi:hypothetical protein